MFGVNSKSSVKTFGDTQESSEKGSEIMQKGSEKKFGDSKTNLKALGKPHKKLLISSFPTHQCLQKQWPIK